jgi:hypothetical protein
MTYGISEANEDFVTAAAFSSAYDRAYLTY